MQVELKEIPVAEVRVTSQRIRTCGSASAIADLVSDIEAEGFHLPIMVCVCDGWDGYVLGEGLRRLEAYQQLDRELIPALVFTGVNPLDIEQAEYKRREYSDYHKLMAALVIR